MPLTDITWNIADSDRVSNSGSGVTFSAVTAAPGPGVLECAVYSPPSSNLTLVAVDLGVPLNDWHGYTPPLGSLTPDSYNGQTIGSLFAGVNRFGFDQSVIVFNATGLAQSFFTSLTINGVTLASAAAAFTDNGVTCTWSWVGTAFYLVDGTYNAAFA